MRLINWVQNYYIRSQFEESYATIYIYTVDNPGWHVKIKLFENIKIIGNYKEFKNDISDKDWAFASLNDGMFDGAGDKTKLCFLMNLFRAWYQNKINDITNHDAHYDDNDLLVWLQNEWFCKLDFGWDGTQYHGIKIMTKSNNAWHVEIEVLNTFLENKYFESIKVQNSNSDWVDIYVTNNIFNGYGDNNKLIFILKEFKRWAERYQNVF